MLPSADSALTSLHALQGGQSALCTADREQILQAGLLHKAVLAAVTILMRGRTLVAAPLDGPLILL